MGDDLSQEQKEQIKSAFLMFADNEQEDGNVPTSNLGTLVRALGKNPTQVEIEEMIKEIESKSGDTFDLSTFKELMYDRINDESNSLEKLSEAFRTLDQEEKGFIPCEQLKHVLTSQGVTEDEITNLILDADINRDNKITYDEFMNMMKSK
jgi:calmodulin